MNIGNHIRRFAQWATASVLLLTLSACAVSTEDEMAVSSKRQAQLGQDTFIYLRCNATGWGVDESTLLAPTEDPDIFTLTFTVDEPWLTEHGGDQCTLTETNEENGWGTWQRAFSNVFSTQLEVPASTPIEPSWQYFSVLYPEQGEYTATLDWSSSMITIEPSGGSEPDLLLDWPVPGEQGTDWVINNYVDLDPSSGVLDYQGGARSYDGHLGVDIDIPTFREMDADFPVLAATAGEVVGFVESNPDRNTSCMGSWNYVTVLTEDGYELTYGHLKQDSVTVSVGQQVVSGEALGVVGSSGCSSQPHLHLEIRDPSGNVLAPFDEGLWREPPPYETPLTVMDFVLSDQPMSSVTDVIDPVDNVSQFTFGSSASIGLSVAGAVPGDELDVEVLRPDGTTYYSTQQDITTDFPHTFWYWNFSISALQGPEGTYTLEVRANGDLQVSYEFDVVAP